MSSLWIETTKDEIQTSSLIKDEKTEICVIGAGLFGLTTAYYLSKYGKKVIVIDKDKIGEKVSGNTTGKITSQHELFYNYLINDYGEEYAKKYLEANEKAIKNIKRIVDEEQIDCDFEIKPAYVFAQKEDEVLDIEKEVNAVNKLGKKAEYVNEIKYFPIQIKGAIKFENQAQFHPRKYMLGLCKSILTQNKIYENTTALEVERSGNNYIIHTDKGDIETEKIVIATHYPILNMPGFYFTKMYQSTSYVIAIEANQKIPYGMFISAKEPIYSFGKENEYKEIFNSKRMKPVKNRWEVKNMVVNTANNLVFDKFRIEPYNIEQIANDNGAIIEKNGDIIGVYKDTIGKVYAVKPICTHLGCLLTWNNTDKTWDCPCHGSRFDYMGKNIYEPAIKGLKTIKI